MYYYYYTEYTDVDSNEALPLSKEFQDHVYIFTKDSYSLAGKLIQQLSFVYFNSCMIKLIYDYIHH